MDYRVFIYLAILAVLVVWFRKYLWVLAYVAFFPILVLVWKLPEFFIRRRSFALFLGCLQATFTALNAFKYNLVTKGVALLGAVFILSGAGRVLILGSAAYLAGLVAWSYVRLARRTLGTSSFLTIQRKHIARIITSDVVQSATSLNEEFKSEDIELYDANQLGQIALNCSFGIVVNKGLYYWASQLERYRRNYSPALIFSLVSYVWLFFGTLLGLSLINDGLLKAEPSQYAFGTAGPSLFAVMDYTMSTFVAGTGGGISPKGDAAYAVHLSGSIIGLVFLAACALNFVLSYRRERDEGALQDLVAELKGRAREQGERFNAEWSVSVDEARRRLDDLGQGVGAIVRFITSRIPADFADDEGA